MFKKPYLLGKTGLGTVPGYDSEYNKRKPPDFSGGFLISIQEKFIRSNWIMT